MLNNFSPCFGPREYYEAWKSHAMPRLLKSPYWQKYKAHILVYFYAVLQVNYSCKFCFVHSR